MLTVDLLALVSKYLLSRALHPLRARTRTDPIEQKQAFQWKMKKRLQPAIQIMALLFPHTGWSLLFFPIYA
jgi:hypothetical protein